MTVSEPTLTSRVSTRIILCILLGALSLPLISCGDDEGVCEQAADIVQRCAAESDLSSTAAEFKEGCQSNPEAYEGWTDCLKKADCTDTAIMRCFAGYNDDDDDEESSTEEETDE